MHQAQAGSEGQVHTVGARDRRRQGVRLWCRQGVRLRFKQGMKVARIIS